MAPSPINSWRTSNNILSTSTLASSDRRQLDVRRLGLLSYEEGIELQRELVEERRAGRVPDVLLLLQHPAVITLGVRGGSRSHIIASDARLAELGIAVHDTGRGGDVTYHG